MKNTTRGAVLAVSCHSFCDAPLIGHFVSDLVSSKTEFEVVPRIPASELVKDIPYKRQELKLQDCFLVPPNTERPEGELYYRGIAKSFDAEKMLKLCKSLHVRPQAFLSACDIYGIMKYFNIQPDFNILNQVSINVRKALNISPISPMIRISLVYLESHITKSTMMKELILSLQKQIDELVPNYELPHFKLCERGEFVVQRPAAMVANCGIIESENADIWVQGGMYDIPDAARMTKGFTSHACTSRGKCNIVFTILHPGCSEDFVQKYTSTVMDLLSNPEKVLDLPLFQ